MGTRSGSQESEPADRSSALQTENRLRMGLWTPQIAMTFRSAVPEHGFRNPTDSSEPTFASKGAF